MSVVFPAPLRPMRPHISPSFTASEASRMIGIGPIDTSRFATLSILSSGHDRLQFDAGNEFLHARIIKCLLRRTVGDDRTVVKSEDAIGKTGDDLHIMLYNQNRDLGA